MTFFQGLQLAQAVAVIVAAGAGIVAAVQSMRVHRAVTRVEVTVNGRMNELLQNATGLARAEGLIAAAASTALAQGVESSRGAATKPEPDPPT